LLYLHREREARAKADRTLNIEITGLSAGREVQIKALSRHVDVSTGAPHGATIDYVSSDRPCTPDAPCQVEWLFDADQLPSDFYYLLIEDAAGNLLWSNPHPERPDFVMLDTWDVQIED
ncbi:MAG: hypothetical protein GTN93_07670, partial [Anaerolineae bacterium]|nr:hypothetical protein [Anaerolineae bacterium]